MNYWLELQYTLIPVTGLFWIAQKGSKAAILEDQNNGRLQKVSDWLTPEEARHQIETRYGY